MPRWCGVWAGQHRNWVLAHPVLASLRSQKCWCRLLLHLQAAKSAALVDTGMMPDAAADAHGITSANLLTAGKDEDLVF